MAGAFYRHSVQRARPSDVVKGRIRYSELQAEITKVRAKRDEAQYRFREAEGALAVAKPLDQEAIKDEIMKRQRLVSEHDEALKTLEEDCAALNATIQDQEAYVFQDELLDFLRSGRYAINPRNLARALAGLPHMKWRQSFGRCSNAGFDPEQHEHAIFQAIARIWKERRAQFSEPPYEFFAAKLPKLPKKLGYTRTFLLEHWRDFKAAIGESWQLKPLPEAFPFLLTSTFIRNTRRTKNAADAILDDREKLS